MSSNKLLDNMGKTVAAVVVTAIGTTIIPGIMDGIKARELQRQEQRKDWIKVPRVKAADLSETQQVITEAKLRYITIKVKPHRRFCNCKANTVINTFPKAGTSVAPTSIITLYYVTQEIINESKQLVVDAENKKAQQKIAQYDKLTDIKTRTRDALAKKRLTKKTLDK